MCSDVFIAGTFTIIGAVIGAWAVRASAIEANRDFARREAANNLRAAFAPYIAGNRINPNRSASEIQKTIYHNINSITVEMEKFRFYVSPEDLPAYSNACDEYQNIARSHDMDFITLKGKMPFKVFEAKVNEVLKFAQP